MATHNSLSFVIDELTKELEVGAHLADCMQMVSLEANRSDVLATSSIDLTCL